MNLYKSKNKASSYLILFFISILLFIFSIVGVFRTIPIFDIFDVTIGKWVSENKVGLNNLSARLDQNEKLNSENIDLRKQILQYEAELGRTQDLKNDYDSLKKLNNVITVKKDMVQTHKISVQTAEKFPSRIFIDKGSKDGIKKDQIVINDTGSLIGKIDEVFEYMSVVVTYYSGDYKTPIYSSSTQTAIVNGIKNDYVYCQDIGQNTSVKEGDIFYTSSIDNKFLDGIFVGKVVKIDQDDKKTFYLDTDILNIDTLYVYL